ncbi:uncharacterized protein LOC9299799 [Arabidopsis lyrata subsp. lyrata]|uniref:uncharacterized protein LOC9299799 n=1 Tax=Arabidopsis lyrata subsp. lyrata TaxID=81972 RepID=UPI000A29B3C8|nr:uncharacterized protein LOC9299799 [Arabidopsis lyrata subsp. lyrata]XP_020871724.1 uncharacterized protein LOC9299799 [Arabidopsis lyrata subsp. lyrata]XP_020871725.1 uncharacterized protein LOC9299799 [Arabidopsis lyrata subsp. lyrata]XP_020871727.1 uncharacterized protein LOC9299799 [Arabidopsis lyrata subsp. lyrata]XP_020871728.1 uncharacterized protein LOC9299799 [Arabidopsis lyrata subsp. lyrata]XP_020871729.1 uncharacterized protein LOC9299799 [Arabidopsis lyrata subsp. lyrata]|eukprot:XP_020871723.1 uncharacterized protein LOC9299799 [Arabidopsis lyrata subsp. lyrata]
MAGRVTLTKAVLSSIPVHSMSTILMPQHSLDRLDKMSKDFIWGSSPEKKKQHLIAWDRVCLPKAEGGLGIRQAKKVNKALLAKLGWRLLHDRVSLWACVIRSKYHVGDVHDQNWTKPKSTWSSTWRSLNTGMREVVIPGLNWVIGDGRRIRFWSDKWVLNTPLRDLAICEIPSGLVEVSARVLWKEGVGRDLANIEPYVPHSIRLRLAAVVLDNVTGAKDRLSWGECADGKFTVKSAYSQLTRMETPKQSMSVFFQRIWRVGAPERIRLFLWLVAHQAIMTNAERYRRHLGDTEICQVCKGGTETIIHALRDCPAMEGIWTRTVPLRKRQSFFASSLLEWLYANLGDETERDGSKWSTKFAVSVWWGWKWRCGNVFGSNGRCRDRVRFLKDLAQEVDVAYLNMAGEAGQPPRVERLICWKPPRDGWMKLNTDGASHGNPGLATAGGVMRDGDGNWCGGFALNIGICSAPLAELWGVYYGLYIAWEKRIRKLEVEVDSVVVVGFLTIGIEDSHPLSFLVRLCYGFLSRDWCVRISHVYREANRLADGLANYAFLLPLGFHMFQGRPELMNSILCEDARGSATPRFVNLLFSFK